MRNLKKIVSLALALMMVLSLMVTANAAFADQDSINPNYNEAVTLMNGIGVLQGDGTNFKPNGTLTRAEAAVILSKIHSAQTSALFFENATKFTENPFADVSGWAKPYVLYCYENGITGGTGATSYSPSKTLTGYEFAKMLLVAAGFGTHADYVGDESQTWQQKTLAVAKEAGLLAGLDITLKNAITREQAAHMALNAMEAGGETTTTYYVATAPQVANVAPATYISKTENAMEAYFSQSVIYNAGTDCYVHTVTETVGNLLANFNLQSGFGADSFGRPATNYTYIAGTYAGRTYMSFPYAATKTYTAATTPATIAADLGAYKTGAYGVAMDTNLIGGTYTYNIVDGTQYTGDYDVTVDTNVNFATVLAGITGANKTVEVYAGLTYPYNQIDRIVVVENLVDEVDTLIPADIYNNVPEFAVMSDGSFVNALGLKIGDVVSYNVNASGAIVNVAKATGAFEGKVTSYTNRGVYTINGTAYILDGKAAGQHGTVQATLSTAASKMYYPGDAGTVLYVDNMPNEVATVYGNYVMVIDTWVTKTSGMWNNDSYSIALKVLKGDGTVAQWSLPVVGSDAAGVYFTLADTNVKHYATWGEADTTLAHMEGAVYTSNDDVLVGELVAHGDDSLDRVFGFQMNGDEADTSTYIVAGDTYVISGDVYLNENTVFVMGDGKGGYTTKTGLTSLNENLVNGYVIGTQTYDATKDTYTRVATLVFAKDSIIAAGTAAATTNVVYNTGVYSVGYDTVNKVPVYTYTVVDVKGAYGTATASSDTVAAGLYTMNTDGSLGTSAGGTVSTVTGVYGTTVALGNGYIVVNNNTVVHDVTVAAKGIVAGATLVWLDTNSDNIADLVYVVG